MTPAELERCDVDHQVRTWYAEPERWTPRGKTPAWPDRVLLDQGHLIDGADVLNLGCFYPEDEIEFAERALSWTAIDFVVPVIDACRRLLRDWPSSVRFLVADMRALPFQGRMFDVVTDFSSGDHLVREDWLRVIDEVHRVLRPNGLFLVCFANHAAFVKILGESWREKPAQVGEYGYTRTDTVEGMVQMLEAGGFDIIGRSHDNDEQLRTGLLARKR